MQSCFHLDLALKLKGINIAMGGGGEGALRLLFRFGNRVLAGRGEISSECLNLFVTACSFPANNLFFPNSLLPTPEFPNPHFFHSFSVVRLSFYSLGEVFKYLNLLLSVSDA